MIIHLKKMRAGRSLPSREAWISVAWKRLFILLASVSLGLMAMECPEPTHKMQKSEPREVPFGAHQPMDIGDETVILVSAQGDEFGVPVRAAFRSPIIKTMRGQAELPEGFQGELPSFFSETEQNEVRLNDISTSTLNYLIPLITRLDQLLAQNDQADAMNKIYIPRRYQPFVNEILEGASTAEIAELYQAADFLELPFIINALAAVIADRIRDQIPQNWNKLNLVQRKEIVEKIAVAEGIHVKQEYILKHVTFRQSGITQEYSIADYIAQHGQPQLEAVGGFNFMDLSEKNLTSLFGIEFLRNKNEIQRLTLSSNCLFDITLDVQRVEHPFAGLGNLQGLYLLFNQLHTLPKAVFAGLGNLRELSLGYNQLQTLPEAVFAGFGNLRWLSLYSNQLHTLPEAVFAGLGNLHELYLACNPMDDTEKQRIRNSLPAGVAKF